MVMASIAKIDGCCPGDISSLLTARIAGAHRQFWWYDLVLSPDLVV